MGRYSARDIYNMERRGRKYLYGEDDEKNTVYHAKKDRYTADDIAKMEKKGYVTPDSPHDDWSADQANKRNITKGYEHYDPSLALFERYRKETEDKRNLANHTMSATERSRSLMDLDYNTQKRLEEYSMPMHAVQQGSMLGNGATVAPYEWTQEAHDKRQQEKEALKADIIKNAKTLSGESAPLSEEDFAEYEKLASDRKKNGWTVPDWNAKRDYEFGKLTKEQQDALLEYAKADRAAGEAGGDAMYVAEASKRGAKDRLEKIKKDAGWDKNTYKTYIQYAASKVNEEHRKQMEQEEYSKLHDKKHDRLDAVGHSLASIGRSPGTGAGAVWANIDALGNADKTQPLDTNSYWFDALNRTQDTRGIIGKDLEKDKTTIAEINGKKVTKGGARRFFYNTAMSAGDSTANVVLGGAAGALTGGASLGENVALGLMGSSAYGSALEEAQNRGLGSRAAQTTAAAAGIIEVLTEKVPTDKLLDAVKTGKNMTKLQAVKSVLKQAGLEGLEEVHGDVLNLVADTLINGDKSEMNEAIREYENKGMTHADAVKQAWFDWTLNTVEDGVSGAISGGFMAGGGIGMSKAVSHTTANDYAKVLTTADDFRAAAESVDDPDSYETKEEKEAAVKVKAELESLAQKAENGEQVTQKEKARAVQKMIDLENAASVEYGENEGEKNARQSGQNMPQNEKITTGNRKSAPQNGAAPENTQNISDSAYKERTQKLLDMDGNRVYTHEDVPAEFARPKAEIAAEDAVRAMSDARTAEQLAEAYNAAKTGAWSGIADLTYEANARRLMDQGTTREELDAARTTTEDAYLSGANGERASFTDARMNAAYMAGLLRRANDIEAEKAPATQRAVTRNGKAFNVEEAVVEDDGTISVRDAEGNTVPIRDLTFRNEATATIYREADALPTVEAKKAFFEYLPEGIAVNSYARYFNRYYNAGRLGRSFADTLKNNGFLTKYMSEDGLKHIFDIGAKENRDEKKSAKTKTRKAEGKVIDKRRDGDKSDPLYKVASKLAGVIGQDIELSEDLGDKVNGEFSKSMAKITLNVASDNAWNTLFHECAGEFLEAWNKNGMEDIQNRFIDYFIDTMGEDDFNRAVEKYRSVYEQAEGEKSFREAANELVNDAIAGIFSTENGINDFVDWLDAKSKPSVLQRIADYLRDIIDTIKDYIGRNANLSDASKRTYRMAEERAASLRARILSELEVARENYEKAAGQGGNDARYSLESESIETIRDDDGHELPVISERDFSTRDINNSLPTVQKLVEETLFSLRGREYMIKSSGEQVRIGKDFAHEYTYSDDTRYGKDVKKKRRVKYNITSGVETMIENAWNGRYETNKKAKHGLDAARGWNYYTTGVALKTKDGYDTYNADLVIRLDKDGNDYVYDITKIRKATSQYPQAGTQGGSSPSNKSIPSSEENATTKSSGKDVAHSINIEDMSTDEMDERYYQAVREGDQKTISAMVRQQAIRKGYDSPKLYHGSPSFGFTKFILSKMDDGASIFATEDFDVAESYSGKTYNTKIKHGIKGDIFKMTDEELFRLGRKYTGKVIRGITGDEFNKYIKKNREVVNSAARDLKKVDIDSSVSNAVNILTRIAKSEDSNDIFWAKGDLDYIVNSYRGNDEIKRIVNNDELRTAIENLTRALKDAADNYYAEDGNIQNRKKLLDVLLKEKRGIYSLFGKTENMFYVNANDKNWNQIESPKEMGLGEGEIVNTREISEYAKRSGYDGVIIEDVKDSGGRTQGADHPTTVWIYFDSNSVKSGDDVTYDDNGNVVPLSERFNDQDKDLRFSLDVSGIENDSEGNELSEGQKEFFKDSKVVDENGNLKVVYHGTMRNFTVFDRSQARGTEDIEAFFFSGDVDEAGGYGNIGQYYLNITNPADYDTAYDIFFKYKGQSGAGIKAREELQALGYDGVIAEDEDEPEYTEYLAFEPNQIKRIDNKKPTEDEDVRFSLSVDLDDEFMPMLDDDEVTGDDVWFSYEGQAEAKAYSDSARNMKDSIKTMTGLLRASGNLFKGIRADASVVQKVAKDIRDLTQTDMPLWQITDNMQKIFDYMQSGDNIDFEDMVKVLSEVSEAIISQGGNVDPVMAEKYNEFLDYLRAFPIKLTDADKAAIRGNGYRSVKEFTNRYFGRIGFSNKGSSLDGRWSEIVEQSDGFLQIVGKEDQIIELARAVDEMKPQAQNDYGESQKEAAYDLAMQIMQSYYEAMAGMMKDRARTEMLQGGGAGAGVQKQLDSLRQKIRAEQNRFRKETKRQTDELVKHYEDELKKLEINNESIQRRREELIEEVRSIDNTRKLLRTQLTDEKVKNRKLSAQLKRVAKQKAQKKDLLQNYKEMQDIRKEKESIIRTANRLIPMIDNPTNKKHVPESMREPLAQFLLGIDFVPHRAKDESANTKHWTQNMQRLSNYLAQVSAHPEDDAAGISFVMDPQLTEAVNDFIERNGDKPKVSLLSANELHELATIMRSISSLITRTNEAFMSDRGETIAQIGSRTISQSRQFKDKAGKLPENVDKLLNTSMLDARTFFEEASGMEIYDALHEGQNIRTRDIKKAGEFAAEIVKGKQINKWRNDEHTFHTVDGDLTLTTGQIMSLYRLMEREQAREHITIGGIKQGEIKESGLKKAIDRMSGKKDQKRPVHITGDQIAQIVETLTPEQKQIADELQKYMADECAKDGNEVTMRMYGYRKFTDKNYFPIRVDSNSTATTDRNRTGGNVSMNAVINMSMTKNVTPHARNAVMIDDIFSVYVNHCVDMATYHGMAMPLADALRWFNYKEIYEGATEDGEIMYASSVKEEVERLMGRGGKKFFENLLEDLNGMSPKANVSGFMDSLVSNYKAAAIAANVRVAIQQPTSYLRASMVMDGRYLAKALGMVPNVAMMRRYRDKVQENSALAWWKSQGFYETSMGRSMEQMILGEDTFAETIKDKAGILAQWGDDFTWAVLYRAAELETEEKHPELKKGSGEYTDAVVKRFEDVIDQTQVVDTTLHRAEIMRSKDGLEKMASSFMSEPVKYWNMLHRAAVNWKRTGNKKVLAKAVTVYIMTNLLTSAAAAIIDAIRNDDDETPWSDLWMDAFVSNTLDNLNPLSLIPFVKDIYTGIAQIFSDNNSYYNKIAERMDMAAVSTLTGAAKQIKKDLEKGEWSYASTRKAAQTLSQFSGIPFYNALRTVEGIHDLVSDDNWYTPGKSGSGGAKESAFDGVYDAIDHDGDISESVRKKVDEYKTNGSTDGQAAGNIKKGVKSRYRDQILELSESGKKSEAAELKNKLIKALTAAGVPRNEAMEYIDGWQE